MRRRPLADLPERYDVIVVGGGINGAGILRELARTGLTVLLLDRRDFAAGTSSASSKLIHGGLRYLKTGQWRLTLESVRERRRLLSEAPGLVSSQEFLMPIYRDTRPGKWVMRLGLWLYDLMAGQRTSRWVDADIVLKREPHLRSEGLLGGLQYSDAQTDDARLVLRLLFESAESGGQMRRIFLRNYTEVLEHRVVGGKVVGIAAVDVETGEQREFESRLVIEATGAAASERSGAPRLRPLRGSHLVFASDRLPVGRAVSWLHPADHRPIFAYPWMGATLYGTTDLDHESTGPAPRMSHFEADYLIEGLSHQFPELKLGVGDALSSYAGVRPVVAGGKGDPSAESRESALWSRPGLVGIAGGKLTTFRVTARQVLREAARQLPEAAPSREESLFAPGANHDPVAQRFGRVAAEYHEQMPDRDQTASLAPGYRRADLRWSARHEQVLHLDDLMLRRTRLGLVAARGGEALLPEVGPICREELGWNESTWQMEQQRYMDIWIRDHSPLNTGGAS